MFDCMQLGFVMWPSCAKLASVREATHRHVTPHMQLPATRRLTRKCFSTSQRASIGRRQQARRRSQALSKGGECGTDNSRLFTSVLHLFWDTFYISQQQPGVFVSCRSLFSLKSSRLIFFPYRRHHGRKVSKPSTTPTSAPCLLEKLRRQRLLVGAGSRIRLAAKKTTSTTKRHTDWLMVSRSAAFLDLFCDHNCISFKSRRRRRRKRYYAFKINHGPTLLPVPKTKLEEVSARS